MGFTKWNESEIDFLKRNYGKVLVSEIAKKISRTPSSIRAKANDLGLKSEIPNSKETHRKIALNFTNELQKSAYLPSENLAYIIGVLNGDGCLCKTDKSYFLKLAVKDKDFAEHFKKILEKWSGLKVCFYKRESPNYKQGFYYEGFLNSKEAYNFLYKFYISKRKNEGIEEIRNFLKKYQLKVKFVEGFFDSEGTISKEGRVVLYNTNKLLLMLFKEIFDEWKIKSKMYERTIGKRDIMGRSFSNPTTCYGLYIQDNKGIKKFCGIISSSIKRKKKRIKTNFIKRKNS